MSIYASIRFKGKIKKEYIKDFNEIIKFNDWSISDIEICREVGKYKGADKMFKADCYYPMAWSDCNKSGREFETTWNKDTGDLKFAFSYNAAHSAWLEESLLDAIKEICERIETFEMYIESTNKEDLEQDKFIDLTERL